MRTVKQILGNKGNEIFSISPSATVYEALELLSEKDIGALPVFEDGKLVGILSERDYARKVILRERTSKDTSVREIMSTNVIYVDGSRTDEECLALMTDKKVRHLPVSDGTDIIGFISIGDVVKSVIDSKEVMIDQLENYIKDKPVLKK